MKRLVGILLLFVNGIIAYAFPGTIAFRSGDSYFFFQNECEIHLKGKDVLANRDVFGTIPLDCNNIGSKNGIQYSVQKTDLQSFLKNHFTELNQSPKILLVYNGHFIHLSTLVKEMDADGYEWFDKTRYVEDIQLIAAGNLKHEGLWKIVANDKTSFVDYGGGVYENTLSTNESPSDSIVVKVDADECVMTLKSSVYYLNMIKGIINNEVLLLYQPFPVSIINNDNGYMLPHTIGKGDTYPCFRQYEVPKDCEGSTFIMYCSSIKESLSLLDIACDGCSFYRDLSGNVRLEIDADGNVSVSSEMDSTRISLVELIIEDNVNACDNKTDIEELELIKSKRIMFGLLFLFILSISASAFLLWAKKREAQDLLLESNDKKESNGIRRKYSKQISIVTIIALVIIVICIILIFINLPDNSIWEWIIGGSCILPIGYSILWSSLQSWKRHESIKISTLTLDKVDLGDKYALYLRGFKQDDYLSGNVKNDSFSEEILFAKVSKLMKSYAIGMTKELYSPMGAERIYFNDDEWQEGVKTLMKSSGIIIINIHNSENCLFEIRESTQYSKKTLCIVTDIEEYKIVKGKMPSVNWPNIDNSNKFFYLGSTDVFNYTPDAITDIITRMDLGNNKD